MMMMVRVAIGVVVVLHDLKAIKGLTDNNAAINYAIISSLLHKCVPMHGLNAAARDSNNPFKMSGARVKYDVIVIVDLGRGVGPGVGADGGQALVGVVGGVG